MGRLSFFLIAGRRTIRIGIDPRILGALATIVFAVLTGFGIFSFRTAQKALDIKRLASLKSENQILRSRISRLANDLEEIKVLLADIYKTDQSIRLTYGIELISGDLKSPGIGGKPDVEMREVGEVVKEVDRLLAAAKFERESFEEINKHLINKFKILAHTPSIMPVNGILTSGFGPRLDPFTGRMRFHEGQDIAAPPGTPIVAPANGVVTVVKRKKGYGLTIEIDHGYGIKTRYAHCMAAKVSSGMRVKRGDVIGMVGNSGRATGPHLHYEVHISGKKVNPLNYIIRHEVVVD
ncbi:MAG TPA: M23 family metallopeptidase [bacterium (Candidatus Stahlbacteria)]|nr:M23 family metallopeptidase [Candidatus Stahlbacteria bacterium]